MVDSEGISYVIKFIILLTISHLTKLYPLFIWIRLQVKIEEVDEEYIGEDFNSEPTVWKTDPISVDHFMNTKDESLDKEVNEISTFNQDCIPRGMST